MNETVNIQAGKENFSSLLLSHFQTAHKAKKLWISNLWSIFLWLNKKIFPLFVLFGDDSKRSGRSNLVSDTHVCFLSATHTNFFRWLCLTTSFVGWDVSTAALDMLWAKKENSFCQSSFASASHFRRVSIYFNSPSVPPALKVLSQPPNPRTSTYALYLRLLLSLKQPRSA